jgi:hypothetical protein
MINCAIQERLRLAIDLYCHQAGREIEADYLYPEDWIVLTNPPLLKVFSPGNISNRGP